MTKAIVLPDKLTSAAANDLICLLDTPFGGAVSIDARHVRFVGARAAEILIRFKTQTEAAGGSVCVMSSADFADDLRLLGLCNHLIEGESSQ